MFLMPVFRGRGFNSIAVVIDESSFYCSHTARHGQNAT
jgi:hypothetical protein